MINKNTTEKRRWANIRKDSRNDRKELRKGLDWGKFYYQINAVWKCNIMHLKIGDHTLKTEKKKKKKKREEIIIEENTAIQY